MSSGQKKQRTASSSWQHRTLSSGRESFGSMQPLSELIDSLPGALRRFVFLSPTTVTAFCLDEVRTDVLFIRQQEVAAFQPQFAKFKSSKKFWRLSLEKNFRLYSIKTKQTTVDLRYRMKVRRSPWRVKSFKSGKSFLSTSFTFNKDVGMTLHRPNLQVGEAPTLLWYPFSHSQPLQCLLYILL